MRLVDTAEGPTDPVGELARCLWCHRRRWSRHRPPRSATNVVITSRGALVVRLVRGRLDVAMSRSARRPRSLVGHTSGGLPSSVASWFSRLRPLGGGRVAARPLQSHSYTVDRTSRRRGRVDSSGNGLAHLANTSPFRRT